MLRVRGQRSGSEGRLTRKRYPEVAGRKKPLFSKVADAARQRVFIGKTHLDGSVLTWREEAVTQGGRAPVASPGYSSLFQGQGPTEEQRQFRKPQTLSVSRGGAGPMGRSRRGAGRGDGPHGARLQVSDSERGDRVDHATPKPVSCGMHGGSGVGST